KEAGILLTEITQPGTLRKMLNDLQVRFRGEQRTSERDGVFVNGESTIPHDRHFVRIGQPVTLKKLSGNQGELVVSYYNHVFDPAISPMNTKANTMSESLVPDRTFTVQAGDDLQL